MNLSFPSSTGSRQVTKNSYTRRVQRGVEVLNQYVPEWYKSIDTEQLKMEDCSRCILGQIYGSYATAILGDLSFIKNHSSNYGPAFYGFDIIGTSNTARMNKRYQKLADTWIKEIEKLKERK